MPQPEKNFRNWKEYGMEFLMLFAAVTLGFFAENQRESLGEKERGVEYAEMLIEDLNLDSTRMEEVMANYQLKIEQINTLIPLMQGSFPQRAFFDSLYKFHTTSGSNSITVGLSFVENLATRDELKAGNMRLIRSDSIIRRLSVYNRKEEIFMGNQTTYRQKRIQIVDLIEEIYDMPLLAKERMEGKQEHVAAVISQDPKTIRTLVNYIVHLQSMVGNLRANARSIAEERVQLKNLLLAYIDSNK
jgi:hypothetical protein